ncbi:hypothetical protein BDZ45DRAFT_751832 [Acephala macrosclerotiorum]|nr:hypothetical protein BDZ45DRAFT_751832 [Acephala macrosclerotiorum]
MKRLFQKHIKGYFERPVVGDDANVNPKFRTKVEEEEVDVYLDMTENRFCRKFTINTHLLCSVHTTPSFSPQLRQSHPRPETASTFTHRRTALLATELLTLHLTSTTMDTDPEMKSQKSATRANMTSRIRGFVTKYFIHILAYQVSMLLLLCIISYLTESLINEPLLTKRHWGYMTDPQTYDCYRAERTATLLALFLGTFGADQWYSRHWARAVFKMLTAGGLGLWSLIDVVLWIVGGIYSTPGCGIQWNGHYAPSNCTATH